MSFIKILETQRQAGFVSASCTLRHELLHADMPFPDLSENMQGVASRDIKLENTLLDSSPRPLVKICDFGYSKHEKFQSAPGSRVGTPAYLAPEVIMTTKGQTYDGKVSTHKRFSCFISSLDLTFIFAMSKIKQIPASLFLNYEV